MPYDTDEKSVRSSKPRELYEFALSGGLIFRFTSDAEDVVDDGDTYTAIPIKRSQLAVVSSGDHPSLTIEIPVTSTLGQVIAANLPPQNILVTVRRKQSDETVVIWLGVVAGATIAGRVMRLRIPVNIDDPAKTKIPGVVVMRMCNHILYKGRCKADRDDFRVAMTVSSVSGLQVVVSTVGGNPDGWFKTGTIEIGAEARTILDQVGTTLHLLAPFTANIAGASGSLYAGCDHTLATCVDKFDQLHNFGGYPYLPRSSPFIDQLVNKPE